MWGNEAVMWFKKYPRAGQRENRSPCFLWLFSFLLDVCLTVWYLHDLPQVNGKLLFKIPPGLCFSKHDTGTSATECPGCLLKCRVRSPRPPLGCIWISGRRAHNVHGIDNAFFQTLKHSCRICVEWYSQGRIELSSHVQLQFLLSTNLDSIPSVLFSFSIL